MASYTFFSRKTGEQVCRILGNGKNWKVIDNIEFQNLRKKHDPEEVLAIEDLLPLFEKGFLIKDDSVTIDLGEPEDTAAQPSAPDPNSITPPVASEDISKRLEPALKIIKEILARAEEKRQEIAEIKAHQQAMELELQNAQVIQTNNGQYYVTMDGDGIGNQVARAQYTDDELKVKEVSDRIEAGKSAFIQWAISFGGTIVEVGGDEGQVKVPAPALEHIEEFRETYHKEVQATVTVGVGKTISESIQARELGKLRGKNQVVYFDENTEKELQLRVDQKGPESPEKKLADSGVIDSAPQAKMGENLPEPSRTPKYAPPKGAFQENQQKQAEYEQWLDSQKRELAS